MNTEIPEDVAKFLSKLKTPTNYANDTPGVSRTNVHNLIHNNTVPHIHIDGRPFIIVDKK